MLGNMNAEIPQKPKGKINIVESLDFSFFCHEVLVRSKLLEQNSRQQQPKNPEVDQLKEGGFVLAQNFGVSAHGQLAPIVLSRCQDKRSWWSACHGTNIYTS